MDDLDNRHVRLALAMKEANVSPEEAHERWGWSRDTLKSNLRGVVQMGPKGAKKYGDKLNVRYEWLYFGRGEMREIRPSKTRPVMSVPLLSWVSAGQFADTGQEIVPEDDEYVLLSGLPRSTYFATRVQGDSMDRYSPDTSVIIVDAQDTEPRSGRSYVFSVDGQTTYKVYQDEPVLRLEPYSTNPFHKPLYPAIEKMTVVGRVVRSFLDLP